MAVYAPFYEIEGRGHRLMVKVPGKPFYVRAERVVIQRPCRYCGSKIGEPCHHDGRYSGASHAIRHERQRVCTDCAGPKEFFHSIGRCRDCRSRHAKLVSAAKCAVVAALRNGTLRRPDACETCGGVSVGGRALDGHHHLGYEPEHQLSVQWLCRRCHRRAHATNDQEAPR